MTPPLRASDADRQSAAERLRLGAGDGRLTVEELEERLDAVYRAQTREELEPLTADLPPDAAELEAAGATARTPVRPGASATGWVVSVMGGGDRRGRWRLARRCRVVNVMGGSDLDLVDAELGAHQVDLTVFSVMGGSRITLPEGLHVEVSKFALMGGHDVDLGGGHTDPTGPVIRLRLISVMGGGEVRRAGADRSRRGRRRRLDTGAPPGAGRLGR